MTTFDTPDQIAAMRLIVMRSSLKLELTTGMKLSRNISAYSLAKKEFGFRGNKQRVYDQLCAMMQAMGLPG